MIYLAVFYSGMLPTEIQVHRKVKLKLYYEYL